MNVHVCECEWGLLVSQRVCVCNTVCVVEDHPYQPFAHKYRVGCRVEGERERRVAREIDGALHIFSQIPHSVRCFAQI